MDSDQRLLFGPDGRVAEKNGRGLMLAILEQAAARPSMTKRMLDTLKAIDGHAQYRSHWIGTHHEIAARAGWKSFKSAQRGCSDCEQAGVLAVELVGSRRIGDPERRLRERRDTEAEFRFQIDWSALQEPLESAEQIVPPSEQSVPPAAQSDPRADQNVPPTSIRAGGADCAETLRASAAADATAEAPTRRRREHEYSAPFLVWWALYPAHRHVKKPPAYRAWRKTTRKLADRFRSQGHPEPEAEAHRFLNDRTTAFALSDTGRHPQFCPYPSSWLNADRFDEDDSAWSRSDSHSGGASAVEQLAKWTEAEMQRRSGR